MSNNDNITSALRVAEGGLQAEVDRARERLLEAGCDEEEVNELILDLVRDALNE